MDYKSIKLEKGMYQTKKSFSQVLEQLDPSENYRGTSLEGLDAFQRQLKRFNINLSGAGADTLSKFFETTESAALFPEYVSRAVRSGIEKNDILRDLVAVTTNIDALDYRSIQSAAGPEDKSLAEVGEGAYIPQTKIKTQENLTRLHKRGRMLVASYEAIKYQRIYLFTLMLSQIGRYIAASQVSDALAVLCANGCKRVTPAGELMYDDLLSASSLLYPYKPTTIIAPEKDLTAILKMDEFSGNYLANTYAKTGAYPGPFGAGLIRSDEAEEYGTVMLDKNYALEKVQAGGVTTEYDKLIDRQLERAAITCTAGFSRIFPDAVCVVK